MRNLQTSLTAVIRKIQMSLTPEIKAGDLKNQQKKNTGMFIGTDNPRQLRVIHALLLRPRSREEIDRIAGASNGPELISKLRKRGLTIECKKTPGFDRDGLPIQFGVYFFSDTDRLKIKMWQRRADSRKNA